METLQKDECEERQKIVDLLLGNKRNFYWQVPLLRRTIDNERPKKRTEIINGKWENVYFVVKSMEQINKMFSRYFYNNEIKKYGIITDINVFSRQRNWQ